MNSPTSTAKPPENEGFTHRQILAIMSGLMLGMFLAALDQTIVATALPTIVGDFHRSNLLSWVITAYLLASTASTPLWARSVTSTGASASSSSPSSCSWWPARSAERRGT